METQELPETINQYRLLSREQTREFLGRISKSKLARLIHSKKDPLPMVKIGSEWKFQIDKLRFWIENRPR